MNRLRSYLPLVVMFVAGITFAALAISCRATLPFNFLPTAIPSLTPTANVTVQILPSATRPTATATSGPVATESIPTPPAVPLPTRTPVEIILIISPIPAPTAVRPTATPVPTALSATSTPSNFPDWRGEYFDNSALVGAPALVRNDREVNFDWSSGSPDGRLPVDNFSVRWTRNQNFGEGNYRFTLHFDDGARLFVDGTQLIDEWRDGGNRTLSADIRLNTGAHALRIEYYERSGLAQAQLQISAAPSASPTPTRTPLPVPSITPLPFPVSTNTPQPTTSPAPTKTPVPTTITPLPLFTATSLPTQPPPPPPTPSPTPIALPTASATSTSVPPTETHTPTPTTGIVTPLPLESDTPAPPTATPTRRPTATPTRPGSPNAQAKLSNGNQLLVTGGNWTKTKDEQVSISVADNPEGKDARQVARAKADSKGVIKANVTLKESPPNPLYIVASGKSGTVVVRAQAAEPTPTLQATVDPSGEATAIP